MTPKQWTNEIIRGVIMSAIAVFGLFGFIAAIGPLVRSFALAMGAGW